MSWVKQITPVIVTTAIGSTAAFANGTAATPSLTFSSDLDTGMYRKAANSLGFSTAGAEAFYIDAAGSLVCVPNGGSTMTQTAVGIGSADTGFYRNSADIGFSIAGTVRGYARAEGLIMVPHASAAAAPTYSFTSDPDTGIYSVGADDVGVSTGGILRFNFDTAAVTSTLPLRLPVGAAATPSVAFTGDLTTGIYRKAANEIGFAVGAAPAGAISNLGFTPVSTGSSYPIGLNYMSQHQYTVFPNTTTGVDFYTTQPSSIIIVLRMGDFVFIDLPAFTGTVAAVSSTMVVSSTQTSGTTVLDAEYTPATSKSAILLTTLAGVNGTSSSCVVASDGSITIDHNSGQFTTGLVATVGLASTRQSMFYSLV